MKCQICGENDSLGVACSSLGPCSLAICQRCAQEGIEPWAFILTAYTGGPKEQYENWFLELVERNMKFWGKTWDDLEKDSEAFWKEYEHACAEDARQP
jgi:hypothetical protein